MQRICGLYLALVGISLIILCNGDTTAQEAVYSCENAAAASVNVTLLDGIWYETARKLNTGETDNSQCVETIFSHNATDIMAQVTYSSDINALHKNQTLNYKLSFNNDDNKLVDGIYNINYNGAERTYKILQVDYDNYVYVCGYISKENIPTTSTTPISTSSSSSSSSSTSSSTTPSSTTVSSSSSTSSTTPNPNEVNGVDKIDAFIFTRNRSVNETFMNYLTTDSSKKFIGFSNLDNVIQSSECWNSAGTKIPAMALIMAVVLSVLKLFN